MSIDNGTVRIFSGWGKNFLTTNNQWKDAWTYICAALDGTWGTFIFGNAKGFNTGTQSHWGTQVFTAINATFTLTVPMQSFESYAVLINNLTTGVTTCTKVLKDSNAFSCTLVVGNEYQIISTEFLLKTK